MSRHIETEIPDIPDLGPSKKHKLSAIEKDISVYNTEYNNVNILLLDTQLPHSTLPNNVLNNPLQAFLSFFTSDNMIIIAENTNLNTETQDATEKWKSSAKCKGRYW